VLAGLHRESFLVHLQLAKKPISETSSQSLNLGLTEPASFSLGSSSIGNYGAWWITESSLLKDTLGRTDTAVSGDQYS